MEDSDKTPLHTDRSDIVVQTRAKFDSLLEDALKTKDKKKKKKSKNQKSDISQDFELPVIKPRLAPLKLREVQETKKLSVNESELSIAPSRKQIEQPTAPPRQQVEQLIAQPIQQIEQPIASPRQQIKPKEYTIIAIPEENEEASLEIIKNDETSLIHSRKSSQQHEAQKTEQMLTLIQQQVSPVVRPKSAKKRKKSKGDDIELHTIDSPVAAPGCLSVNIHGCRPLPHRNGNGGNPQLIRIHLVDADSGTELAPSQKVNLTSQQRKGAYWNMDVELTFSIPLQLAVETAGTVLFLEILTCVPGTRMLTPALSCYSRSEIQEKCLAWCFLKLKGSSGHLNCDTKLRLQLYEPLPNFRRCFSNDFKLVYSWWLKGPWRKMPGCTWIEVTVKAVTVTSNGQNDDPQVISDEKQDEQHRRTSVHSQNISVDEQMSSGKQETPILQVEWLKRSGQLCHIPSSNPALTLSQRTTQCLCLAFSPSGEQLASGAAGYNIFIFKIPTFKETCILTGHQGLVYDLTWRSENELFSASADCTVIEWNLINGNVAKIIPHPTFVYCCVLCGDDILTGCKDGIVRIWRRGVSENNEDWDLWQELEGHEGFVTSLCCIPRSTNLVASSDSEGVILLWHKNQNDWSKDRQISVFGLGTTSICSLIPHPGGSRLLIHARDSLVRSIDLATGTLLQQFAGALTHKIQTGCCISPCGTLLYAGSEDGSVLVWQADTGQLLATLPPSTSACLPVTSLAHHPRGNLIVSGHFGTSPEPVIVWISHQDTDTAQELKEKGQDGSPQVTGQLRLKDIIASIDRALVIKS